MNATRIGLKARYVMAMQVTVDNIQEVELWCSGSIRGMLLPVEQRIVQLQSTVSGHEEDASIGNWIVRVGHLNNRMLYIVCTDEVFKRVFSRFDR